MAAGSNFCRSEVFDVLSKTLQNLRFSSEESRPNDCDKGFLDIVDVSERQTFRTTVRPSFVTMDLDMLEKKIKRLVNKLKKSNIHLEVFDAGDIEYGATLGKGGEGLVQCCLVKYNGLRIKAAVKTVLNNSDDSLSLTFDEIELLCLARDPIVTTTIQVYGVAAVPDERDSEMGHLVIITEAGLMNVLQLYQNENIPLHVTYDIWSHLAAALHCIHTKKIIHQDLKPENILVTGIFRDMDGHIDKVQVKVIDLGMARLVEGERVYTDDILGTEGYHAPEVLFDDSYDFRADVFVLGITFCVLLLPRSSLKKTVLAPILKSFHEAKKAKFVGSGLFNFVMGSRMASNDLISSDIRNLLCSMLESVENRSITLLDISSRCHKESVLLRQQQQPAAVMQSDSAGRLYHQDSGIDSLEYAIISDVATKRNTRSNAGRAVKASQRTKSQEEQAKKRTTRRSHTRLASSSTGSDANSSRSLNNAKKRSSKTATRDEPICRRTRSAKRPHDDQTYNVSPDDKGRGESFKKPPAKRMLRSKS